MVMTVAVDLLDCLVDKKEKNDMNYKIDSNHLIQYQYKNKIERTKGWQQI